MLAKLDSSVRAGMNVPARILLIALFSCVAAFGSNVGDTYQQVLKEKGEPKSQMDAGSVRLLTYPDVTIKLEDDVVVSIKAVVAPTKAPTASPSSAKPLSPGAQVSLLKRQLDDAVAKVREIVNQEVTPLPRDPKLQLWEYYFHDGATRPA